MMHDRATGDAITINTAPARAMTLALRRTVFLERERPPDDYEVRHDGRDRLPHLPHAVHRAGAVAMDPGMRAVAWPEWRCGR